MTKPTNDGEVRKILLSMPPGRWLALRNGYANISVNPVEMYTNHFQTKAASKIYHYDAARITTEATRREKSNTRETLRAIFYALHTSPTSPLKSLSWASDQQSMIFSRVRFGEDKLQISDLEYIGSNDKVVQASIDLDFLGEVELFNIVDYCSRRFPQIDIAEALKPLNALFSKHPSLQLNELFQVGANKFYLLKESGRDSLGQNLHIKRGYTLLAKSAMLGPLLNLSVKNAVFHDPVLVSDFIMAYFGIRQTALASTILTSQQLSHLERLLSRIKVSITYAQRPPKSIAFLGNSAATLSFVKHGASSSTKILVVDFFRPGESVFVFKQIYRNTNHERRVPEAAELC